MKARPPGEPQRKRLESRVRRFILDNSLLPEDRRLLLAVSGGADSSALLLIMSRLAKNLRLGLGVAHFDHRLRSEAEAKRELGFVRELCHELGLPFFHGQGDVRSQAQMKRLSIEEAARRARYEFLASVALGEGFLAVATGHTASDQAETVLLNLIRGAGLYGLAGMRAAASWPTGQAGLSLVRPLLRITRSETQEYCRAAAVTPIEDESNVSRRYRRNRLRHEVLPLLRQMNPRIESALVRLADAAAEDTAFMQSLGTSALLPPAGVTQQLSLGRLRELAPAPRRQALKLGFAAAAGDPRELARSHLEALERLAVAGATGDGLDLPRGVRAVKQRETLELSPAVPQATLPDEPVTLRVPGETTFGHLCVTASREPLPAGVWAEVDQEAAGGSLTVRRRRPGDRFQPLGMDQAKKLQDFFTDAHVPRDARDAVPLFVARGGIVWVGGLRVAEWAKARPPRPTIYLTYRTV